jgi:hypothetical protein
MHNYNKDDILQGGHVCNCKVIKYIRPIKFWYSGHEPTETQIDIRKSTNIYLENRINFFVYV